MSDETFGARLKRLRLARKAGSNEWGGPAFSRNMGIVRSTLHSWESGQYKIADKYIPRLARLLGCTEKYLRAGTDEPIGARLRRLRSAKQREWREAWSGDEIARQVEVSRLTVWLWEAGHRMPNDAHMARLAEWLGCSEHYLRHGTEDPFNAQLIELQAKVRAFLTHRRPGRSRERRELQQMVQA